MQPLRFGCVRYLNAVPLAAGLERLAGAEVVLAAPSELAPMLRCGRVDVALASIVDAVTGDPPLAIIPGGMIGCDGPTLTVRVFSRTPFDRVGVVHADRESHTSVVLCAIVLRRMFGAAPEIRGFTPGAGAWPDCVLLIGDKVVNDAPPASMYPHSLDLGEAWKTLTGGPFVYAAWMCRADEAGAPHVRLASRILDRLRRRNALRIDRLMGAHATGHGWPADLARAYVGSHLRYDLGPAALAGAQSFIDEAGALGLVPAGALRYAGAG